MLRGLIRSQVRAVMGVGGASGARDPAADPAAAPAPDSLFGPGSAAWTVHGDLPAMMVGGVASLMLQMLHPAALAGVLDHSDFRRDMRGRLARTARFVGVTTYGPAVEAEAAIARVSAIHARVTGTMPDGTRYAANDPALLAWVHVAETTSFLAAHLRYRDPAFPRARQDAYHAEMAVLARRLGAAPVPETQAAAMAWLVAMRPRLRADERTRDTVRALREQPAPQPAIAPFQRLLLDAGADLLPRWARALHGIRIAVPTRIAIRAGMAGTGGLVRWAMRAEQDAG